MTYPTHRITLRIRPGEGLSLTMDCPWDVHDSSRPCWPQLNGENSDTPYPPDEGAAVGCVWAGILEVEGLNALTGPEFPIMFTAHPAYEGVSRGLKFQLGGGMWATQEAER